MPLETATYISDLNVANPAHTDGLSQADSHMRLLKSTAKATFPNFTAAALVSSQAQLDAAAGAAAGTVVHTIPLGTALLPGLTPVGDPNTGLWSPAADQLALSLGGVQALLMGGTALVTSLGVQAAAFTTAGAYSGGTGQLVPIGSTLLWWDDVLPTEGGYAWANGGTISRTGNPVLWARWGVRFSSGDGSTTFGLPDLRGAAPSGKDTMGGAVSSGRLTTITSFAKNTLGAFLGFETNSLSVANIPTLTSSAANNISVLSSQTGIPSGATTGAALTNQGGTYYGPASLSQLVVGQITSNGSNNISVTSSGTGGTPVTNTGTRTTCNFIIRIG